MRKFLSLFLVLLVFLRFYAQDNSPPFKDFGGPMTTITFNSRGLSHTMGGGGTFLTFDNYVIGIFGQGTTDAFYRSVELNNGKYNLKSRYTGFWLGYNKNLNRDGLYMSLYNRVAFGRVYLNNELLKTDLYDEVIVLVPTIELTHKVFSFLDIGLSFFYEYYMGVQLYNYTQKDFNSYGIGLFLKFNSI